MTVHARLVQPRSKVSKLTLLKCDEDGMVAKEFEQDSDITISETTQTVQPSFHYNKMVRDMYGKSFDLSLSSSLRL